MNTPRPRLILLPAMVMAIVLVAAFALDSETPRVLAQSGGVQTFLTVAGPAEVPLGNRARMIAVLKDGEGNPIPGEVIRFTTPSTFAGVTSEMEIGDIATGEDGVATFDYQLRVGGANQFIARFYGTTAHPPAEARTEILATGTAQLAQRSAGVTVPFFGAWTIVAVVSVVWFIFLLVMRLVSQIPEAGLHTGMEDK